MIPNQILVILTLTSTGIFFGLPPILLKLILREFNTFTTVFIRFTFTLLLILPLVLTKKAHLVQKKDLPHLLLLSLLPASNVILFIIGLQHTTAMVSNLMYSLVPINTLILAKIFLKEKLSLNKTLGILLGFLGALILIFYPLLSTSKFLISSLGTPKGNLIIVAASFIWTYYLILSKKLSRKFSPLTLSFFSFLSIPVISLPLALFETINHSALRQTPTLTGFFSFVILIIFATIAPIFLNQWTIKRTSPVIASMYQYITIATTVALAVIFLSEKLTLPFLLGGLLIILSVFLVSTLPYLKSKRLSQEKQLTT